MQKGILVIMQNTKLYYDKVKGVVDMEYGYVMVYFEGGSCHAMNPSPHLIEGSTVGVDSHGRVWTK
jgi:hypothetical protein